MVQMPAPHPCGSLIKLRMCLGTFGLELFFLRTSQSCFVRFFTAYKPFMVQMPAPHPCGSLIKLRMCLGTFGLDQPFFIRSKNSLLVFVLVKRSNINSIADVSFIGCNTLRNTHIICSSSGSVSFSSRRVPERLILIPG